MTGTYTPIANHCPQCGSTSCLTYQAIPPSTRRYTAEDGSDTQEVYGETRDYLCSNCGCEFTLTDWEDA